MGSWLVLSLSKATTVGIPFICKEQNLQKIQQCRILLPPRVISIVSCLPMIDRVYGYLLNPTLHKLSYLTFYSSHFPSLLLFRPDNPFKTEYLAYSFTTSAGHSIELARQPFILTAHHRIGS